MVVQGPRWLHEDDHAEQEAQKPIAPKRSVCVGSFLMNKLVVYVAEHYV
jgi:hypothetical protein